MRLLTTDPPPPWPLAEMLHALPFARSAEAIGVLRWRVEENRRPLRVEEALVVVENGRVWDLAILHRFPDYGGHWRLSCVRAARVPHVPFRGYDHPPTEADIEGFLRGSWWRVRDPRRWHTQASGAQAPWWWTPAQN